ncbi:MAG: hypothetical protein HGA61_02685 [Candidatus Moranbacteria bacterium]|nr:hypothetical protein [Candidatus Moranbacteria bacterium]
MTTKENLQIPEDFQVLVSNLLEINTNYCEEFRKQARMLKEYQRKHPTRIMVFKCMDGRIAFPTFTETPLGFLRNFRNLGGQFNFGWKGLKAAVTDFVQKSHDEGRGSLGIVTYHYSKGDPKRGCAGHKCNVGASIDGAMAFKRQLRRAYEGLPFGFFPIVVGIETDEEALKLHNGGGDVFDLSQVSADITADAMFEKLLALYRHIPGNILDDLNPLLMGNVRHIKKVRSSERLPANLEHSEWIIGAGGASAYDWLHVPNTALLVGQYNPNIERPIKEALGVVRKNWQPGKKFLYMSAASYGGNNYEQLVKDEVKYYARIILETAQTHYPELISDMFRVRALVDVRTQEMKLF